MSAKGRNGGKVRKTRYTDYERWVGLPHYMLKGTNWKTMTPNAKALLIEVWARYNGANNGEISYSVREAVEIGLHRNKAGRALQELVDRGFLQVARNSSFSMKTREARLWTITALPMPDGTAATKNFTKQQNDPPKFRTQSHPWDTQSHQRDREQQMERKTGPTVPPVGPSDPESPSSQSHPWDTSNYHGGCRGKRRVASVLGAREASEAARLAPAPPSSASLGPANGGLYPISKAINGVMCTYGDLLPDNPARRKHET